MLGEKNWMGLILPFAPTLRLTTDSERVAGGSSEAAGWGDTPFPVVRTMWFGSSETSPPPLCQIPAWEFSSVPIPDSSLHMEVMAWVVVLTPTTMPR